jgi:hypothetical protein
MKNVYGLLFALALGIAGGLLNWSYLAKKSRDLQRVGFVGVKQGVVLQVGDIFRADDLEKVEIPQERVGNLMDYAVLYSEVGTVVGLPVIREFAGGQLVLEKDLRAPAPEPRQLTSDEREIGIPVDVRTFVPSLYKAGDMISFVVPKVRSAQTTPAIAPSDEAADNATEDTPTPAQAVNAALGTETIGPFEIRTVGNRVASTDLSKANRIPQMQENVVNIIVKVQGNELEPRAQKLLALMLNYNVRQFAILGHPRPKQ